MNEKKSFKVVLWALVFAVFFPISVFVLSSYSLSTLSAIVIIAINAVLFGVYTLKMIQRIKAMDEVQIRIQLEAVSVAFVLSLLLIMILGMAGQVDKLASTTLDFLYIFPMLFGFYFIGLFISKAKYK